MKKNLLHVLLYSFRKVSHKREKFPLTVVLDHLVPLILFIFVYSVQNFPAVIVWQITTTRDFLSTDALVKVSHKHPIIGK